MCAPDRMLMPMTSTSSWIGGVDDLLRGAVETRVDDVHARVAQAPRHDLDAAIVAVEAHLGNEHSNGLIARIHLASSGGWPEDQDMDDAPIRV